METTEIFSTKAEKYARYRWDYAPQAIQRIFEITGIANQSLVADIGAGTGILTRHFVGRCKLVYAIEPNGAMRALAEQALGSIAGCCVLDGRAEATGLAEHSLDLITVAQALNWFDPQPTREEFRRILKPSGWLVDLRNLCTYGSDLDTALQTIYPKETDTTAWNKGRGMPLSFYFDHQDFWQESFVFSQAETWEQFFGSLATASYAPDERSELFGRFEQAAREAFERFRASGMVVSEVETKLCVGRIRNLSINQTELVFDETSKFL
jgi:ubiquinone/menaquinone biosynthesis C-methylase UbiE